eukprot:Opistho-2@17180
MLLLLLPLWRPYRVHIFNRRHFGEYFRIKQRDLFGELRRFGLWYNAIEPLFERFRRRSHEQILHRHGLRTVHRTQFIEHLSRNPEILLTNICQESRQHRVEIGIVGKVLVVPSYPVHNSVDHERHDRPPPLFKVCLVVLVGVVDHSHVEAGRHHFKQRNGRHERPVGKKKRPHVVDVPLTLVCQSLCKLFGRPRDDLNLRCLGFARLLLLAFRCLWVVRSLLIALGCFRVVGLQQRTLRLVVVVHLYAKDHLVHSALAEVHDLHGATPGIRKRGSSGPCAYRRCRRGRKPPLVNVALRPHHAHRSPAKSAAGYAHRSLGRRGCQTRTSGGGGCSGRSSPPVGMGCASDRRRHSRVCDSACDVCGGSGVVGSCRLNPLWSVIHKRTLETGRCQRAVAICLLQLRRKRKTQSRRHFRNCYFGLCYSGYNNATLITTNNRSRRRHRIRPHKIICRSVREYDNGERRLGRAGGVTCSFVRCRLHRCRRCRCR